MTLIIENCDFFEDALLEVMNVLHGFVVKEDRNYDDDKRIRNILDDLDNFNLTFILQDVDMLIYTMLLSMKNITVAQVDEMNEIAFKELNFPNEEVEQEYIRLITQCVDLMRLLKSKYNMEYKEIEYLVPNSKLLTVRVSVSIKGLFYFLASCAKYDELMDITLLFSNYDALLETIVTISMSLSDLIVVDDIFMRMKLDEHNRKSILESGDTPIFIISDEEYINYCMVNNHNSVKLSTIGSCSLVAYREILENITKQDIKIENFNDFIDQENFSISLPAIYTSIERDDANIIDGYIYDWYLLVYKLKEFEDYNIEKVLCCLNCFVNVFKMNTPIYNYFEMDSELTEVNEIMYKIQSEILPQGGN